MKRIYQIEYDFDGQEHGDSLVIDESRDVQQQGLNWLNETWKDEKEDDPFIASDILSLEPVHVLTDGNGNHYDISHTIDTYLTEVQEGSK